MIRRLAALPVVAVLLAAAAFLVSAPAASAASGPLWQIKVTPNADYFLSGNAEYAGVYKIEAKNVGDEPSSGEIKVENILPSGLNAEGVKFFFSVTDGANLAEFGSCPSLSECIFPGLLVFFGIHSVAPGQKMVMTVLAEVPGGVEGPLEDVAKVYEEGNLVGEGSAENAASANPTFGTFHFDAALTEASGNPYTQAGGHPYEFITEFNFGTASVSEPTSEGWEQSGTAPVQDAKETVVDLPPGLLANPQGVPTCALADYFTQECDTSKVVVGSGCIRLFGWTEDGCRVVDPVFNLQPEGSYPGQLGMTVANLPLIVITTDIRSASDYGATATAVAAEANVSRVRVTLWGVPADSSHDALRGKECGDASPSGQFLSVEEREKACGEDMSAGGAPGGHSTVPPTPFLTLPSNCSGEPLTISGRYNSWQNPAEFTSRSVQVPAVDGCNHLSFQPTIESRPTTNLADAPTGFEFKLHVPQNNDPEGVSTPSLKEAVVHFPKGLTINPASGDGLSACSEEQVGLHEEAAAACPDASKLGAVEVKTPLLIEPLLGALYLATPHQNPTGSLLAGYIVLEGQGVRIKLPGSFETDPQTGQITAKFSQNPQLPFEDLHLNIFGGARGSLRTPAVCGSYQTTSSLTPFSAPESGPPATPASSFETSAAENGGPCPSSAGQEPNAPRFIAGSETPQAGIYSPFSLKLVRQDGEQEIKGLDTTLPEGLVGKLAGIPYCPDAAIAAASNKTGTEEQASPSCPASSEVGTVEVGAGAGPTPLNVPGHVYLSGPYKGAPISLTIITPAVAGPFDLGTVVVRAALYVNPETTQIHAVSDPIPTILEGIPLDVRSVTLKMARPKFTLNPTSCEESHFIGSATSILGTSSPLEQRFQLGGCSALAFKPKLALRLSGHLKRRGHPALTSVLTMPPGGANIASAVVALPPTEILDNAHIKSPCTRVEFAADACPPGSVLGSATAITPLLDKPLEGPVYLMTGFGHKLPDLLVDLGGQIQITLDGKVDTTKAGGLRTTFATVPDAPVSKFVLKLAGARKGLLQNTVPICANPQRASALFSGQNAASVGLSPKLKASCPKGKRHQRAGRRRGHP